MCKRGGRGGSGGVTWLNGWFNIFFPFLKDKKKSNPFCQAYHPTQSYVTPGKEDCDSGIDELDLPNGISSAPVEWNYLGEKNPLTFKSGFLCAKQDPITKTISPHVGWYIIRNT